VGPYKPVFSVDVGYYYVGGTSMAAPHVSGIAALVAEDFPDTDQKTMERYLKNAAKGNPLLEWNVVLFPIHRKSILIL
jgi:subtilisin family serine protease